MFNFLYCFDSNYNIQASCSIYSLLEQVDEKINIYVMHKDFNNEENFLDDILNHRMLNKLTVYKINLDSYDFPNIQGTHVSEATYYRLFLEDYIDRNISFITYLDCDVFCINNPLELIKKNIDNMQILESTISVATEASLSQHGKENLKMDSNQYFNAGVMVIDFNDWKKQKLKQKFQDILKNYNSKLTYWDQDILNKTFDGSYTELYSDLNHKVEMAETGISKNYDERSLNTLSLLHYSGKFKPWSIKGAANYNSKYFQDVYRVLYKKKYYLSFNYRLNAVKDLLRTFKHKSIYKMEFPITFIFISIKSIILKS